MAYAFNEDRSKVDVYTADQIDAMHIVDKETIDAKNAQQDQVIADETAARILADSTESGARSAADTLINARIDTLVDHGTGGIEVRELLWQQAGGVNSGTINLPADFDAANYDCLECECGVAYPSWKIVGYQRIPVTGGTLHSAESDGSNDAMFTALALSVSGTVVTCGNAGNASSGDGGSTWGVASASVMVSKIYGIKYAQDCSAEVADIRVGYNGIVYDTAGDSVRTQAISSLSNLRKKTGTGFWCKGSYNTPTSEKYMHFLYFPSNDMRNNMSLENGGVITVSCPSGYSIRIDALQAGVQTRSFGTNQGSVTLASMYIYPGEGFWIEIGKFANDDVDDYLADPDFMAGITVEIATPNSGLFDLSDTSNSSVIDPEWHFGYFDLSTGIWATSATDSYITTYLQYCEHDTYVAMESDIPGISSRIYTYFDDSAHLSNYTFCGFDGCFAFVPAGGYYAFGLCGASKASYTDETFADDDAWFDYIDNHVKCVAIDLGGYDDMLPMYKVNETFNKADLKRGYWSWGELVSSNNYISTDFFGPADYPMIIKAYLDPNPGVTSEWSYDASHPNGPMLSVRVTSADRQTSKIFASPSSCPVVYGVVKAGEYWNVRLQRGNTAPEDLPFNISIEKTFFTDEQPLNEKKPVKILAIGNSWARDTVKYIAKILYSAGIESVIGQPYMGGSSLSDQYFGIDDLDYYYMHNGVQQKSHETFRYDKYVNSANVVSDYGTATDAEDYNNGQNNKGCTLERCVTDEDWDYVLFEFSQAGSLDFRQVNGTAGHSSENPNTNELFDINNFVNRIKLMMDPDVANACKFGIIVPWTPPAGTTVFNSSAYYKYFNNGAVPVSQSDKDRIYEEANASRLVTHQYIAEYMGSDCKIFIDLNEPMNKARECGPFVHISTGADDPLPTGFGFKMNRNNDNTHLANGLPMYLMSLVVAYKFGATPDKITFNVIASSGAAADGDSGTTINPKTSNIADNVLAREIIWKAVN